VLFEKQATHYRKTMNIVTITSQKRIMMEALKTAQFALIFADNRSHALLTFAPALHMKQVCGGQQA